MKTKILLLEAFLNKHCPIFQKRGFIHPRELSLRFISKVSRLLSCEKLLMAL